MATYHVPHQQLIKYNHVKAGLLWFGAGLVGVILSSRIMIWIFWDSGLVTGNANIFDQIFSMYLLQCGIVFFWALVSGVQRFTLRRYLAYQFPGWRKDLLIVTIISGLWLVNSVNGFIRLPISLFQVLGWGVLAGIFQQSLLPQHVPFRRRGIWILLSLMSFMAAFMFVFPPEFLGISQQLAMPWLDMFRSWSVFASRMLFWSMYLLPMAGFFGWLSQSIPIELE